MLSIQKHRTTIVEIDVATINVDIDGADVEFLAQVRDRAGDLVLTGTPDVDAQAADDVVEFHFAFDAADLVAAELGEGLRFGAMCTTDDLGPFTLLEDDAEIVMPTAYEEPAP